MSSIAACPACAAAPLAEELAKPATTPDLHFSLPTIHCAACIGKVERALNAMPEITEARVNLSLKRVAITGKHANPDTIIQTLNTIGFDAFPLDAALLDQTKDTAARALLNRLAVAGFAMMNVMLLSVAIWSGATDATRDLFHFISAAITLPVVAYSAQPFFQSAWKALKVGTLNMDVPISLAILLAAGMSLYETVQGGEHAYFDAALSLTFFLLIGRYLDHRTRMAARSAASELAALEVHTAQTRREDRWEPTPVGDLHIGDEILVPTGGRVAVDGILNSQTATLDRSFLTGESASVQSTLGDAIQAGEINQGAPIEIVATAVGEDTTLRRIASMIERAENSRSSYTALADRAAQVYAPLVHILALLAFITWVWISGDIRFSLNIAIAVLIITCPCALGLAVPAVATAAIGRLYGSGFLVKHDTALERLAEVDTVVFDKTGTLTLPVSSLDLTDTEKSVVAGLASASDHPVSRAILGTLGRITPAQLTGIEEIAGHGIEATYNGQTVRLGKAAWIGAEFAGTGLKIGTAPAKPLSGGEIIREGAAHAVSEFRNAGLEVHLMTGDHADAATKVAVELGFDHVESNISAQQKYERLQAMAAEGRKVVMIGDGLNDTAALAAAHASIAPSTALDASRSAADVVVLSASFKDLPTILKIARATTHLSKQNFLIAAIYNLIAVPIALLGFATPLLAALAMSASSISVLLNALRVRFAR